MYNYSLSRARRVIENTFGILAARYITIMQLYFKGGCTQIFFFVYIDGDYSDDPLLPSQKMLCALRRLQFPSIIISEPQSMDCNCPPGYINGEDGSGNIIEGRWRRDDEACTSMQPVARISKERRCNIHISAVGPTKKS